MVGTFFLCFFDVKNLNGFTNLLCFQVFAILFSGKLNTPVSICRFPVLSPTVFGQDAGNFTQLL